ncbi:hypothetical protein RI065_07615 [Mycoplasmatota bacterium zrk1]
MESRLFKYVVILVILFVGVSLGNNDNDLQSKLDRFEEEIQQPYNEHSGQSLEVYDTNVMNSLAKKSENLLMNSLDVIRDVVNSVFGTLFG